MNFVRLLAPILALLLLAAHFSRHQMPLLMWICAALPFLLLIKQPWVARATQVVLVLGAAEWLRTMFTILNTRQAAGAPWMRLVAILLPVALFTLLSALAFRSPALKRRYGLIPEERAAPDAPSAEAADDTPTNSL